MPQTQGSAQPLGVFQPNRKAGPAVTRRPVQLLVITDQIEITHSEWAGPRWSDVTFAIHLLIKDTSVPV